MSVGGFFSSGFTRQPKGLIGYVLTAYAALFVLWSAYAAVFSRLDALVLVTLFLSFMLVLVFSTIAAVSERPEHDSDRVPFYDWAFVLCSICCGVYFALNADAIATRITLLDPLSIYGYNVRQSVDHSVSRGVSSNGRVTADRYRYLVLWSTTCTVTCYRLRLVMGISVLSISWIS